MASDVRVASGGGPGLSSGEAARRLEHDGPNALPTRKRVPVWRRVLTQLSDPLIIVLLVAIALTVVTGDWTDAAVIALVIVVNTTVGVIQEVKADQAITALATMTAPEARVLRDGRQRLIPASEVVVGDLLVLTEGDIVPADATLTEAAALLVDESALTGESVPVDKSADSDNIVSSGTVVVRGRGRAMVTAVGTTSAMGRIAGLMATGSGLTPLQHRLVGVGRILAGTAVVLCTVVLALGLARGESLELMVVTAISLVVAAVPESLPAVVTLALALGARRMAARHALIRRLPAVETLGSVTVIATDKTGTLTEGRMVARRLWTPTGTAELDGHGYSPEGTIRRKRRPVTAHNTPDVGRLLTAAALCTDATIHSPAAPDGDWAALGDPTEAALLAAAGKAGLDPTALKTALPRVGELPFDSDRKRMTTVHRQSGGVRIICKGAPEVLLSAMFLDEPPALITRCAEQADTLAGDGYRVLAVAQADHDTAPPVEQWERGLRLLGLIGIRDPARPSAATTIAACQTAGITPVLITGDHPATARAVATEVGIIDIGDDVIDCRVPSATDRLRHARVFARATPEQKLDIITARRQAGDIVAMTGDGVNDGPALRHADIGVAMGLRGTEVARRAADLVLADDELATVVAAAEEGRRVYANIRRFLLYGLSGGAAEIAVMLAGPFLGLPLFLLPAQILWVNLLTHGLPGVALGSEPAPPDVMKRPPRPPAESVLGAGLWQRILRVGVVIAAVTLGIAVWANATDRPWQSMAFFALGATQLAVALGSRARPGSRANPMLLVAVAAALALQFAGLYLPMLNELLGTEPVPLLDLLIICALSTLGYAAIRLDRLVHPGRRPATPTPGPSRR
ncbi:cation-translocating P-type ATPase [Paractinoplanes brasiliensis]|uniref:Ca2+-transporting ATPase n=1 Tax=Paractinoplanes brasiliensis TaxID=52695 RepID=A0A4R6JYV8_9ACTN|nr:cation-transporting P-type ATPase [Actinoplanes brasiliensis]TDO41949.1 Ca2+-transporting ATPase [Actinoplanes brasiliensis]GID29769.1 ATPase [Actinoplanes brasiliensis]